MEAICIEQEAADKLMEMIFNGERVVVPIICETCAGTYNTELPDGSIGIDFTLECRSEDDEYLGAFHCPLRTEDVVRAMKDSELKGTLRDHVAATWYEQGVEHFKQESK